MGGTENEDDSAGRDDKTFRHFIEGINGRAALV
jgi:hypothetical protein